MLMDDPYIENIDRDEKALELAMNLCYKVGKRAQGMRHTHADASSDQLDLANFDVVFLAALVGSFQADKEDLLERIVRKMDVGSVLVVRSAHGLRTLLYPVGGPSTFM